LAGVPVNFLVQLQAFLRPVFSVTPFKKFSSFPDIG